MNEIVSFTKEIDFNNNIEKINSISLEHTISYDKDSSIKGDLIVSGTYRQNQVTLIDTPFSYKVPIDILIDSKYDLSNITIDIDNFTYDLIDNSKLKINVDILIDKLELKKEDDEIININDLFLEKEEKEKLEVPEIDDNKNDNLVEREIVYKEDVDNDSLFSNLNSSCESYITYSIYIMKENDSIENIMDKYKVSRTQLEEYNDLNEIKQGTKIIIPNSNE